MIGDLTCTPCGSTDVMSICPGADAIYWVGRSLDDQDIGVAPLLLTPAVPTVCYCLRCWIATFRMNASASPHNERQSIDAAIRSAE